MTKPTHVVYVIEAQGTGYYKIGVSSDLEHRLETIQDGCPVLCSLLCYVRVPERSMAFVVEKNLHWYFAESRSMREWFKLNDRDVELLKGGLLDKALRDYKKGHYWKHHDKPSDICLSSVLSRMAAEKPADGKPKKRVRRVSALTSGMDRYTNIGKPL